VLKWAVLNPLGNPKAIAFAIRQGRVQTAVKWAAVGPRGNPKAIAVAMAVPVVLEAAIPRLAVMAVRVAAAVAAAAAATVVVVAATAAAVASDDSRLRQTLPNLMPKESSDIHSRGVRES
jgi:hypothetical protein